MTVHTDIPTRVPIPWARIDEFCQKWAVVEFALFGSVLRDDFGPESDVDVLVTFAPGARRTLFDLGDMEEELTEIFGRPVDLSTRAGVERSENPFRRRAILDSVRVIYAAA
jgi:predicted nucleotidyltransferase